MLFLFLGKINARINHIHNYKYRRLHVVRRHTIGRQPLIHQRRICHCAGTDGRLFPAYFSNHVADGEKMIPAMIVLFAASGVVIGLGYVVLSFADSIKDLLFG